ncbi:MAG: porin family protein [Sulfuricaulis sp.]
MDIRSCLGFWVLLASFPALAVDQHADREWTGLYAGVKAGYGFGDVKSGTGDYDPAFPFPPSSMDIDGAGWGMVLGYYWQRPNLLLGIELDALDMDMKSSSSIYSDPIPGLANGCDATRASCPIHVEQQVKTLYTARVKVGHTAERYVVYGTAGIAVGEVERSMRETMQYWGPTGMWGSARHKSVGWTLGGGADYALTRNIWLQTQFLYVDLGNEHYRFEDTPGFVFDQNASITFSVLSFGISYKF